MDQTGHEPRSEEQGHERRESKAHLTAVPNLADSVRRARVEAAEQAQVLADLRNGEIARLEMLAEAIRPVLAQVPEEVDLFDVGVAAGQRPRLFVDMIGFVEMARDRRTYRFLQDTRHGRLTLLESERIEQVTQAVADYVARRLLEREKALAADMTVEEAARRLLAPKPAASAAASAAAPAAVETTPAEGQNEAAARLPAATPFALTGAATAAPALRPPALSPPPIAPERRGAAETALLFVIQFLGAAALTLLVAAACWQLWRMFVAVDG